MSPPIPDQHPPAQPFTAPSAGGVPLAVRAGTALAWLGTLIALVLASREAGLPTFFCPVRGGCETVLASRYAQIRGVPLPFIGLAYYLIHLGIWLAVYALGRKELRLRFLEGIIGLALAGVTFSAGLMYVQFGVLHAFCPLCTASAMTTAGLLFAAVRARRDITAGAAGASPSGAAMLGFFALLPLVILVEAYSSSSAGMGGQVPWMELSAGHRVGPADAPVQLSVFSDFQCGFCRDLDPVLSRLTDEFPQKLSIVFRHFPLEMHPRAYAAAVASECAAEQGAFREYAGKLHTQEEKLADADFLALAAALHLDQDRFAACLRSEPPRKAVDASLRDAARLGLAGVPAVFLNGRPITGVLDYDHLVGEIRAALPPATQKD